MNGLIDFALKMAGLPDNVVADLNAAAPSLARLVELSKQIEPIISKPQTLAQHIALIIPLLKAAYPDVQSVIPLAEELIAFATVKGVV